MAAGAVGCLRCVVSEFRLETQVVALIACMFACIYVARKEEREEQRYRRRRATHCLGRSFSARKGTEIPADPSSRTPRRRSMTHWFHE